MKTRIFSILFFISIVLLISCNDDFLDRAPLDSLNDANFWIEEATSVSASAACYGFINKSGTLDFEYMSDNNLYYDNNAGFELISAGFHDYYNGTMASFWANGYGAIFRCNKFLENYSKGTYDPELKERMAAEARFLRAYYYGQMIMLFGDVQFVKHTISPGDPEVYGSRTDKKVILDFLLTELEESAPLLPVTYPATDKGRATRGAAYALKARLAMFFGEYAVAEQAARNVMDLGVYELYNVGNPNTNYYQLFRYSGKPSTNTANKEDIFYVPYLQGKVHHNLSRELQLPTPRLDENIRWSPTKSLVDSYLCDDGKPITSSDRYKGAKSIDPGTKTYADYFRNRDPRMYQTILTPYSIIQEQIVDKGGNAGDLGYWLKVGNKFSEPTFPINTTGVNYVLSRTGFYFSKYCEIGGAPSGADGVSENINNYNYDWNDIRIIRYAEVLLTYAEARLEQGLLSQEDIDKTINLLRDRVGMKRMVKSEVEAWGLNLRDEIRRERRVELALDGVRYFDILRWKEGKLLAADKKGMNKKLVEKFTDTSQPDKVKNLPVDNSGDLILFTDRIFQEPKHYTWPIPQTQRDINKNLSQNPGW